jgi:hypothetical protein
MRTVKTLALLALAGAIAGAVVATLIAPGIISWYQTPGAATLAMCPCAETARQTTSQLIRSQLTGAAAGASLMLIIGIVYRVTHRQRSAAAGAASSAAGSKNAGVPTDESA